MRALVFLLVVAACTPAEPPVAPNDPGGMPIARSEPAESGPFAAGQVWRGVYQCPQGPTTLRLLVGSSKGTAVQGIFDFSHAQSGSKGQFFLSGNYDAETRRLALEPGEWIARPQGYETVGLDGTLSSDGTVYEGRITNRECGKFRVTLEAH